MPLNKKNPINLKRLLLIKKNVCKKFKINMNKQLFKKINALNH